MEKKEFARIRNQEDVLLGLGFTQDEAEQLRRISTTLHRWHELECGTDGGCVERDEKTNKPYWVSEWGTQWGPGKRCRRLIADRETGALKRLAKIIERRNSFGDVENHVSGGCTITKREPVSTYIQTDPRGAALYIIRPGDVPEGGDIGAYYSRGICVY